MRTLLIHDWYDCLRCEVGELEALLSHCAQIDKKSRYLKRGLDEGVVLSYPLFVFICGSLILLSVAIYWVGFKSIVISSRCFPFPYCVKRALGRKEQQWQHDMSWFSCFSIISSTKWTCMSGPILVMTPSAFVHWETTGLGKPEVRVSDLWVRRWPMGLACSLGVGAGLIGSWNEKRLRMTLACFTAPYSYYYSTRSGFD